MAAILAAISDDVTDPNSAKTQNVYLIHVEHITSYLLEVKYFRNIVTPKKPKIYNSSPRPNFYKRFEIHGTKLFFSGLLSLYLDEFWV